MNHLNHLLKFTLLLLQIVVLFNSCHIQQNVAGIYTAPIRGRYPNTIPVTNYIELKNDGTFYYQFKGGFIEKISYGKWEKRMNSKEIHIKSIITNLSNISISVKETASNNDHYVFILNNPLRSNTGVKWILNIDGKKYQMNTDSLILKKNTKICKFYMEGYLSYPDTVSLIPFPLQDRIRSETYKVKDEKSNLYHITFTHPIDYSIFYYTPFLDSLAIKRRTIFVDGIKMKKMINR